MQRRAILGAAVGFIAGGVFAVREAPAQGRRPSEREIARAQQAVEARLVELGAKNAQVFPLDDDVVTREFPNHLFFGVRFRLYPVAFAPPEGLRSQNIFVVDRERKVQSFTAVAPLQEFIFDASRPATEDVDQKRLAEAWLRISQEFVQDGFYKFDPPAGLTVANDGEDEKVTGSTAVAQGGKGDILATLTFSPRGKLIGISHKVNITEGPRPRIAGGPGQP